VFRDGAILVAGNRIVAVGSAKDLGRDHAGAVVEDYGDAVILPGLVNAHCHLELSHLTPPPNPKSFVDWLAAVMAPSSQPASVADSVRAGIEESLRFGVTLVGDISKEPQTARVVLSESALAAVSYGEVVGMAGRKHLFAPRLAAALDPSSSGPRLRIGVSPHAPYSVDWQGYRNCVDAARALELPLTTHVAESPDEEAFLKRHAGPFRELWNRLGAWTDPPKREMNGPVGFAYSARLLYYPLTLLAHVNHCDDTDMDLLWRGVASVVYCPRTHAYFGHPPHRWRNMLARQINVCVGSDSRASSPDLNLVDDLRLIYRQAPEVAPATLWEMATIRGARALGMERGWGTLAAGKNADCVVFPATTDDPLREILQRQVLPLAVWADGREVVTAAR
jgi:cytosine/adenosine deaminase-related metal-dependent hydrolase